MNNTNRALNRILILVTGVIFLAVAAVLALLATQASAQSAFDTGAATIRTTVTQWLQATPLTVTVPGGVPHSWLWLVAIAVLVVIIIALLSIIVRQGRGHTGQLISEQTTDWGSTRVDSAVAEQSLHHALAAHTEFLSARVSTYRVARSAVLKISVTCRRGTNPADAVRVVEHNLRALDDLLGRSIPALVQVSGGFRVRTARTSRIT